MSCRATPPPPILQVVHPRPAHLHRSHIGAQLSHSANPSGDGGAAPDDPVPIIHVKYAELVRRVEADRECRRRFVGGVMPDIVVRHWKQLGYSVRSGAQVCARLDWGVPRHLSLRVVRFTKLRHSTVCYWQDDFGANIDDMLHAQILDTITSASTPGVLVLLTGDGNMNSGALY
jgi:hypothetical protein